MTREMNKPDWHSKWVKTECYYGTLYEFKKEKPKERVLDDWIKPFFENCCRMEKVNVGKR